MISLEKARDIAFAETARIAAQRKFAGLEILPSRLFRENRVHWVFGAPIPKLQEEGWAPGAIMVTVDKHDGHIWTDEDFDSYAKSIQSEKLIAA